MSVSRDVLEALSTTHIRDPIPLEALAPALNSKPFIPSKSLINIRDLGAVPGSAIRPGLIFRSGMLDAAAADPEAISWLASNVKTVFDLRSVEERAAYPSPEVPGVEFVYHERVATYPQPTPADFAVDDGSTAWREQLMAVMAAYKPSLRAVLQHVKDNPNEPFLFHCTGKKTALYYVQHNSEKLPRLITPYSTKAGRDRTGVTAGLLQTLAGTPEKDVILDYMLSRIGTEPARERLIAFVKDNIDVQDYEVPGFWNMVSLRPTFWKAFVGGVDAEYGGWEGYVKGLGFSGEELKTIKKNLRG
ncbi:protein-tyrosine phosphatase-like protein [Fusarium acuminatum]|jgi:protein tyrosine/serine phosphatase|uniref:Protein-tyrosine phosphatase-like protein n=1 Tax=Fusarium acuminatum TaxID=5515 RepID=A0ABZ2WUT7_9HYPO